MTQQWVLFSTFLLYIFKPVKSQISDNLNKKIDDLKIKLMKQKLKYEE